MSWRFFLRALTKDLPLEDIVDELRDFDERFAIILRRHLAVLSWWCVINVLTGAIGLLLAQGNWWYFFLMNISWAIINFSIVLWIFDHSYYRRFAKGNVFERSEVQHHIEKMMLFNVGLDLMYIFAGLFLLTLGYLNEISYPELWVGFGHSVILQGTYLFIQDNYFHRLHRINYKKCKPFFEDVIESQISFRKSELQGARKS